MQTLVEKLNQLKCDVVTAARLAEFWEKQIHVHGERKAENFYLSLGLNHIKKKGYDFEGLTLSREPTDAEKIAVKGVSQAQESNRKRLKEILTSLRTELIDDALTALKDIDSAEYHTLIVQAPTEFRATLRTTLTTVFNEGRRLVAYELGATKQDEDEEDDEELDALTDVTLSRVTNDVQSRVIGSAAKWALLGLAGAALIGSVQTDINAGSVSYIDQAAREAANKVIAMGRFDEMQRRSDDIDHYLYSALLDQNTCPRCLADDGRESNDIEDLPETPNIECDGGPSCRCFIIAVRV